MNCLPIRGNFNPLGRAPLCFADQPYAYAGNHPLIHVDPSGQRPRMLAGGDGVTAAPATHTAHWGQRARIRTVPGRSDCRNISWANYNSCYRTWSVARTKMLVTTGRWAFGFIAGGLLLDVIADVVLMVAGHSTTKLLEGVIDIAAVIVGLLTYLPLATGNSQDWAPVTTIVAAFHSWAVLARGALALYHTLGSFAEGAVDAAATVIRSAAGGIPGLFMRLVLWIAGSAFNNWLAAGGHALLSVGLGIYAEYQREANEDLIIWCTETSENRRACASAPYVG
jgi:hypothetical protein